VSLIDPPPRLVDWTILAAVTLALVTGVSSLLVGTPSGAWVFVLHGVGALTLVVLLFFKFRRVRHRVTGRWNVTIALSVLLGIVTLGALTTGVAWVLGMHPDLWRWTLLSLHIGLGLLVVPLVLLHLRQRFRLPSTNDWEGRRTTLQYAGLVAFGALAWRTNELLIASLDTPGENHRFTGSKPEPGTGNRFPATSWMLDDPDLIDAHSWKLHVTGLVDEPLSLAYDDFSTMSEKRAVLDCTSGWYTERDWQGVPVSAILETTGTRDDARWIVFHSVTGYRFGFPLAEADDLLLATHVDGEQLSHGHGFPLRVVAPGRRGFQWVKWVTAIEVRRTRDIGQWLSIFISGID
jgi:hypothetical protein